MNIKLVCVGRLKERFTRDACDEYLKRLSRYASLRLDEVPDEKAPEALSPALREQVKAAEGARILERIADNEYVIALAIDAKQLSSEAFADKLDSLMLSGRSDIAFIIGGSLGLSPEVLRRADFALSFSPMTFSHQIFRVMLLEQIYRAFRILRNEPYHK